MNSSLSCALLSARRAASSCARDSVMSSQTISAFAPSGPSATRVVSFTHIVEPSLQIFRKDLLAHHAGLVEARREMVHHGIAIFRMNELKHALAEQLAGGVAEVLRGVVIHAAHGAGAVDREEHRRSRVVEQSETESRSCGAPSSACSRSRKSSQLHQPETDLVRDDLHEVELIGAPLAILRSTWLSASR